MTAAENGAQRAARRAAARGLVVGHPVRADITAPGTNWPLGGNVTYTKADRPAGQRPLVPLERVDRLARYLLQRDVATHVRHGINWRPSPRQRRRLDKKERAAAVRTYVAGKREEARYALEHGDAYYAAMSGEPQPTPAQRANAAADAMVEQAKPRGFRVVDRRGEHRA